VYSGFRTKQYSDRPTMTRLFYSGVSGFSEWLHKNNPCKGRTLRFEKSQSEEASYAVRFL